MPSGLFSAVVQLSILSLPAIPVSPNSNNIISEHQNSFSLITAAFDMFLLARALFRFSGWLAGVFVCLFVFAFPFIMCFIASADLMHPYVSPHRSWKIPQATTPAYCVLP